MPPTIKLMKGVFKALVDDDMKRAIARSGRNVGGMLAQRLMRLRDREPQPPPPCS
ncbi:hypothetical protein ACC784_17355 [Rhizobium ruizarguesonis]|uniref:hypothetical protein n=1 Tax=Rhizobium TaxID=379 RepID=UPI0013F16A24|nr:hypothetical protein [Rhizobium ruizarguesonis]